MEQKYLEFEPKTRYLGKMILENWCKFEIILAAVIILDLISINTCVSKYLQFNSLDYLTEWKMVETLHTQIKSKRAETHFAKLYEITQKFEKECNNLLTNEGGDSSSFIVV